MDNRRTSKRAAGARRGDRPGPGAALNEEAQFLNDSLVQLMVDLADKGREVICAGLDHDLPRPQNLGQPEGNMS